MCSQPIAEAFAVLIVRLTLGIKSKSMGRRHQKGLIKTTAEEELFKKMRLDLNLSDSGYCGMAGAFGFEVDHYDTAMRVGELMLLPAVRKAGKDTLLIADGFSCRNRFHKPLIATQCISLKCGNGH
jgi:hypothetical protein